MSSPGPLIRRSAVAIGIALLAVQVGLVAYEHLGPTRYFAWAPNDYVVQYRLTATVDGHRLSAAGVRSRSRNSQSRLGDLQSVLSLDRGPGRRQVNIRYILVGHSDNHTRLVEVNRRARTIDRNSLKALLKHEMPTHRTFAVFN